MRAVRQGATLALLAHACWLLSAVAAAADAPYNPGVLEPCKNDQYLQVTVGVPREYTQGDDAFAYEAKGLHPRQVCAVVAFGTPYQLLSWLENGTVQSAVLTDFAVRVMQSDNPLRFNQDFYILPAKSLLTLPARERRLLLTDGAGNPELKPYARLDDFFSALHLGYTAESILLPSHLSPATPFLIRSAAAWTERHPLDKDAREDFYKRLLTAIRFGDPGSSEATTLRLSDELIPSSESQRAVMANELRPERGMNLALLDRVVVRKRVLLASRELRELVDPDSPDAELKPQAVPPPDPDPVPLFASTGILESALGPTLTDFRDANYRRVQFGTVAQRHFRFTISELWSLLQKADEGASPHAANDKLALVLTGGGVKAAYQTSMIDYLYDKQRLVNPGGDAPRKDYTQQVDYVIGTSGGALLGVFVAAMDQKFDEVRRRQPANRLTSILWKEPGEGIHSYDVFPLLDMMRYASMIAALIVVWMVSVVMLAFFRARYPQVTRIDHADESFLDRRKRAFKESWPWMLLLVLAPITILKVAGVNRVEHVPTETGLYYALMALVAFYSDVRLFPIKPFKWLRARFDRKTVIVGLLGFLLIALALWRPKWLEHLSPFQDAGLLFVNLCCAGFLALILTLHLFFHAQNEYFRPEPRAQIFRAFGVLLGIVLLSYFGVVFAMWLAVTSLLEMHGGFWGYFLIFAAVLTVTYMWLGGARSATTATSWPQATLGYLFSEYRSRAMFGSERRFMRFMALTVMAWLWWNALAAPALYGNGNARAYLDGAFCRFTALAHADVKAKASCARQGAKHAPGADFPLAVPFVITATSLEKSQERYFLFVSSKSDVDATLSPEAWFNVVRDPRWVVVRKPLDTELQDAAFASGSPFPVFSAHDVQLRALHNNERLIDGGFAHNKPLEAALALGARKVLVINSSPLEAVAQAGHCSMFSLNFGELACNLPKLLPYLWERSQVEDLLSTRGMVVASIYPTATDGPWPSLTDFRRETVEDLIGEATRDQTRRVGVIESWGAPPFEPAGLIGYDASMIATEIKSHKQ